VNEHDRRVATLAALFAPERAPSLLARLAPPADVEAPAHAARLAGGSRRDRLEALAATLAVDAAAVRIRAEGAASTERARVATILRALGTGGAAPAAAPLVLRLCRERIGC
jgi:hypothetical protein